MVALFFGVFIGVLMMIPAEVISSKWVNGTGYIFPNANYSENVLIQGNITYNEFYMIASFHNDSEPVFSIPSTMVLYNLTFDSFSSNGFKNASNSKFTAQVAGKYKVDFSLSFAAATTGGEYSLIVVKNGIEQTQTESYRSLTSANVWGSAGGHGIISLQPGDNITFNIEDEAGSAHNVKLKAHQLAITRVGN